ncbi:MAG: hypothetical protein JJT76_15515 [Clostridiaceae bacterium]|nr:hypothetical protein [Clostridiaceae bacterium]
MKINKVTFLLALVVVLSTMICSYGATDRLEEELGFVGHSPDYGLRTWEIKAIYTIETQEYTNNKAVVNHDVWGHLYSMAYPEHEEGNGAFRLISATVYEDSELKHKHYRNQFSRYEYISDPTWVVYLAHEKWVYDNIDINSTGESRAQFRFNNNNFIPMNDWNATLSHTF